MEQILAFGLGVVAVAFVWVVVVAFKTASKISKLETNLQDTINLIDDNNKTGYDRDLALDRRVDQEMDRVDLIFTNVLSTLDSRLDKLEQKLTSVNKDGCEPTKKILKK